jgi:HNH endonuclease
VRKNFENFLVQYKEFVSQLVHKRGSGGRSRTAIKEYHRFVLDAMIDGNDGPTVLQKLRSSPTFSFLSEGLDVEAPSDSSKGFSRGVKTAAYLKDALANAIVCAICGARLYRNSIHIDHVQRRQNGGSASLEDAQLTHPFCNSTVKG